MTDLIVREETKPSLFNASPARQVQMATEMADVLRDVVEKQKLYENIQGKKYLRVEGWNTLGSFLGILAKEDKVIRLEDGSYEAYVNLINTKNGMIVGTGSALCSVKERRWGNADEYARRSMSITRATGKAFRLNFSWIITLAGYQPTPEEEMPSEMPREQPRQQAQPIETVMPIEERRAKMLLAFEKICITKEMVEDRLGHIVDTASEEELKTLAKAYAVLKALDTAFLGAQNKGYSKKDIETDTGLTIDEIRKSDIKRLGDIIEMLVSVPDKNNN